VLIVIKLSAVVMNVTMQSVVVLIVIMLNTVVLNVILNCVVLIVIMLHATGSNVVMQSVVVLNVIVLNAVRASVVASFYNSPWGITCSSECYFNYENAKKKSLINTLVRRSSYPHLIDT
jgi:hypothetical protein